jgi:DNA-binding NtrC family response regulator
VLVSYFVDRYARRQGKKIRSVAKESLDFLEAYDWPGNIRELQNVIERSVIVCDTETLRVDESWLVREGPTSSQVLSVELTSHEKELIEAALTESRGRVSGPTGAAARLGVPASTLESKIRALKISKHRFRNA